MQRVFNRNNGAYSTVLTLAFYLLDLVTNLATTVFRFVYFLSRSFGFIRLNCSTYLVFDERGKVMSISSLRCGIPPDFSLRFNLLHPHLNRCLQTLAENEIARWEINQQT